MFTNTSLRHVYIRDEYVFLGGWGSTLSYPYVNYDTEQVAKKVA